MGVFKMAATHRLKRRNGIWYYRRRVPQDLVEKLGKKVIQYSLETGDLKAAARKREIADLEWSARFAELTEGGINTSDSAPQPAAVPPSTATLLDLVIGYVQRGDARFRETIAKDPPETAAQAAEMIQNVERELQMLTDREDPRGEEDITLLANRLLRAAGFSTQALGPKSPEFGELVRRAIIELDRRRLAAYRDDHSRAFFDHLFDPARAPEITFGTVADQYLAQTVEEAGANGHSQKWIDKQAASLALIREIVGDDTPIRFVDYDLCLKARSLLARTPVNRSKLYPGVPLTEAIERAEADGKATLSPVTQDGYLAALRGVLDLATKKRLVPVNPAHGLTPIKRDAIASADKRKPFTPEQFAQFFNSEFYRDCASSGPAPYKHDTKGWRFWLPLICLFSGMRPNEVCQMGSNDIRQTKTGIWYFDVVSTDDDDEGPGKTLKTATSRRRVPVHPELIKIGLIDYAAHRRGENEAQLFTITPDKYGNFATYPLRRFREDYLPRAITMEPRQSFYSFRHNFRDALRRIGAPPDALQALGGWSQGKSVSDDYGDKANPDYQIQFIKGVAYPGLDLTHLRINR